MYCVRPTSHRVARALAPSAIPKCLSAARHGTVSSQHTYDHNDFCQNEFTEVHAPLCRCRSPPLLPRCTWLLLLLLLSVRPPPLVQQSSRLPPRTRRSPITKLTQICFAFFFLFFLSSPHAMAPLSRPPLAAPTVFFCVCGDGWEEGSWLISVAEATRSHQGRPLGDERRERLGGA